MHLVLALVHQEPASQREDGGVDGGPSEKDAKVEADTGVQVEEDLSTSFDDCWESRVLAMCVPVLHVDLESCFLWWDQGKTYHSVAASRSPSRRNAAQCQCRRRMSRRW